MKKSFDEVVLETLATVHEDDREALARYVDEKRETIETERFPGYFWFTYKPYLFAIYDLESFYQNAELNWNSVWKEEKGRFIVAEDQFHHNEELYVDKNDGGVYFETYSNGEIKISNSLYDVWSRFLAKFPESSKILESAKRTDFDPEKIDVAPLAAYLPYDSEEKLWEIYAALYPFRSKDEEETGRLSFGECEITPENFYIRSAFEITFPFPKRVFLPESEDRPPRLILEIGMETEDEGADPADGVLYYDPTTRKVFRVGNYEWERWISVRPSRKDAFDVSPLASFASTNRFSESVQKEDSDRREQFFSKRAFEYFSSLNAVSATPLLKELGLDPETYYNPRSGVFAKVLRRVFSSLLPPTVEVLAFSENNRVAETLSDFIDSLREIDAKG